MNAEDLKFPMVVFWKSSRTTYAVEESDHGTLNYTKVGAVPGYYPNSTIKRTLAELINQGEVVVLASPQATPVKLTIDVEATEATAKLEAATQAAKELTTALKDVRGLLGMPRETLD